MSDNENTIECICRRYRVQTPGGMVVEVESIKPLSGQMNHELLEEDCEINSFFSNHKIVSSIRQIVATSSNVKKADKVISRPSSQQGRFTPRQRLNNILKMVGEFTRNDYRKYMLDTYGVKIERHTSHKDFQQALAIHRIEVVKERPGRQATYRVIDPADIDTTLYNTMINDHKIKMGIMR